MKTDKDRPSTWVKYSQGLCQNCHASCCTMPVEVKSSDLLRMEIITEDELSGSRRKLARRLIKDKIIISFREGTDLYMLGSRPNGDCQFLHEKTRLCTVYEKRPDVCREFPSVGPRVGFCPAKNKFLKV